MIDVATNILLWQILANQTLFTFEERGQEVAYVFETAESSLLLNFKYITKGTTDDITQLSDVAIIHQRQARGLSKQIVVLETLIFVLIMTTMFITRQTRGTNSLDHNLFRSPESAETHSILALWDLRPIRVTTSSGLVLKQTREMKWNGVVSFDQRGNVTLFETPTLTYVNVGVN